MHEGTSPPHPPRNLLLSALPRDAYDRLAPSLERVPLVYRSVLYEQDRPIDHVYFPIVGVCSLVKETPGGAPIEVATAGREGFLGFSALLGVDVSTELVICQIPGEALRMTRDALHDAARTVPELADVLLRYTHALIGMIAQASACNRLHNVEERAARWLLMTHDRVDGDAFRLTQDFLAQMLGVRRQAVNVAAGILARAGLVSYVRGEMRILDRPGLEAASCECYRVIQNTFARLLGVPPP